MKSLKRWLVENQDSARASLPGLWKDCELDTLLQRTRVDCFVLVLDAGFVRF